MEENVPVNVRPTTNGRVGVTPIFMKGQEPLPPGFTEDDRPFFEQQKKYAAFFPMVMESCPGKCVMAGGMGFGLGALLSLMSASFAYEDPYLRGTNPATMNNTQKARVIFKEMGKGMWTQGKGFGKVGAIYSAVECCIEGYRAKNDIYNSVSAGFLSGAILARNAGPQAMMGGGVLFAAFSAAIDTFMRREPADDD